MTGADFLRESLRKCVKEDELFPMHDRKPFPLEDAIYG